MIRRRLFPPIVAFALLASCSGSSATGPPSAPSDAGLVVGAAPTIRWDAPTYTATAGQVKVAMVNTDSVRHELVLLDGTGKTVVPGLDLDAEAGQEDDGTITLQPGTYRVFCRIPGHANMNSELVVS